MSSPVVPLRINPSEAVINAASPTDTRSANTRSARPSQFVSTLESVPPSPTPFLSSPPASPVPPAPEKQETVLFPDGTQYTGSLQGGKAEGRGKTIFSPEHVLIDYEGDFHNGLAHGRGTAKFREGGSYAGQMREGKMTGQGTRTYSEDDPDNRFIYKGEFENSSPHGQGQMRYRDGSTYKGSYQNGVAEGPGKFWQPDGYCEEGFFRKGQLWDGTKSKPTGAGGTTTITIKDGQRLSDCSCVIL